MGASKLMRELERRICQQSAGEDFRTARQRRAASGDAAAVPAAGFPVPVSAATIDLGPLRRHAGALSDTLGGQAVPQGVADVLRRRRGQGEPLPDLARSRMSEQFQMDLTPVRIHNDAESHDLADAVQSVAFTHGSDIYFSRGSYQPDSSAGQHLLAHELAHVATPEPARTGQTIIGRADDPAEAAAAATADRVVAQLRRSYHPAEGTAPGPASASDRMGHAVRRMSVANTDWTAATGARHSSGGAVGVMIVRDGGTPVVVKAGEGFLDEAAVAATVLTAATTGAEGRWKASAPGARPVGAAEAKRIKTMLEALLPPDQKRTSRTQGFLDNLDNNKGVMVYGFAEGAELESALADEDQTTAKGIRGKRSLREDSISYQLMNDPGMMRMFGRASAADVLLGNADRFVGKVNLQNVMVDAVAKSISLIDNVEANNESVLRSMPATGIDGKKSFDAWTDHFRVATLAQRDFGGISHTVVEMLGDSIRQIPLKNEDRATVIKAYTKKTSQMEVWFAGGLQAGTDAVLDALKDPVKVTAAVPDNTREEVITSLLARRFYLNGMTAAQAWAAAVAQAQKLMARLQRPNMPPLPALPTMPPLPALPPTGPGRPGSAAPGGPGRAALTRPRRPAGTPPPARQ